MSLGSTDQPQVLFPSRQKAILHLMGNFLPSAHSELDLCCARCPREVSVWHQQAPTTAWALLAQRMLKSRMVQMGGTAFRGTLSACLARIHPWSWMQFETEALDRAGHAGQPIFCFPPELASTPNFYQQHIYTTDCHFAILQVSRAPMSF